MSTATTLLPIRVPSVGESITSGVLGSWKKKNGDAVSSGEALFEIETDKVTSEVFAEADGTIEILIPEGTEVKVGQTVGNLHPGKAPSRKSTPPETPQREKAEVTPLPKTPARETQPTPSPVLIHSDADAAVEDADRRGNRAAGSYGLLERRRHPLAVGLGQAVRDERGFEGHDGPAGCHGLGHVARNVKQVAHAGASSAVNHSA